MQPGDRLVCSFVKAVKVGQSFKTWPLHVTVVPWFRLSTLSDQLAQELHEALSQVQPFLVLMGEETTMGRGKLVNLVQQPTPLAEVEEQTRQLLKQRQAWLVDETTKRRREYQPHVTEQKEARLYTGDTFACDTLYIVEQKGGHKEVVATIGLS